MQEWKSKGDSYDDIVREYGPWSAMAILLPDGTYTRPEAADFRLRRLVQVAADAVGKPLNECRVLDLACLEGHYGIEFALQGAETVCTDIRDANVAKTAFVAEKLGLDRLTVYKDDVLNLSPENYGMFDIIVCSGILYHLEGEGAHKLLKAMAQCCRGVTLVDTYVALSADDTKHIDGMALTGAHYQEHLPGTDKKERLKDLWASVDNDSSFWFTTTAPHPGLTTDRKAFLALKGEPVTIKSSTITQGQPHKTVDVEAPVSLHPSQIKHNVVHSVAKQVLPQNIKDMIKPALRSVGVLPKVQVPDWEKDAGEKQ